MKVLFVKEGTIISSKIYISWVERKFTKKAISEPLLYAYRYTALWESFWTASVLKILLWYPLKSCGHILVAAPLEKLSHLSIHKNCSSSTNELHKPSNNSKRMVNTVCMVGLLTIAEQPAPTLLNDHIVALSDLCGQIIVISASLLVPNFVTIVLNCGTVVIPCIRVHRIMFRLVITLNSLSIYHTVLPISTKQLQLI